MKDAILGLLSSKKALMALLSAATWVAGKAGLDLDSEVLLPAVLPLWTYILGQGIADHGKEKVLASAPLAAREAEKLKALIAASDAAADEAASKLPTERPVPPQD